MKNDYRRDIMIKLTKQQMVAGYLVEHGSISSLEAINAFWATRLSAIIFDMKKDGWIFDTTREKHEPTGSTFARYHLVARP